MTLHGPRKKNSPRVLTRAARLVEADAERGDVHGRLRRLVARRRARDVELRDLHLARPSVVITRRVLFVENKAVIFRMRHVVTNEIIPPRARVRSARARALRVQTS